MGYFWQWGDREWATVVMERQQGAWVIVPRPHWHRLFSNSTGTMGVYCSHQETEVHERELDLWWVVTAASWEHCWHLQKSFMNRKVKYIFFSHKHSFVLIENETQSNSAQITFKLNLDRLSAELTQHFACLLNATRLTRPIWVIHPWVWRLIRCHKKPCSLKYLKENVTPLENAHSWQMFYRLLQRWPGTCV